jgi:ElaB/YqjD/DUF883 family membrane-anchored ribosome-binding protein
MKKTSDDVSSETLLNDLKVLVKDGEVLLRTGMGSLSKKGEELRKQLAEVLEAAKVICRHLEEQAIAGAKATDRAIRENPYESVGLAFGIGLLLGLTAGRR